MFKKVINAKGFWKSVFTLGFAFAVLFTLIKWALDGFDWAFFTEINLLTFFPTLIAAGFVYGFFVTFGKYRAKIKDHNPK